MGLIKFKFPYDFGNEIALLGDFNGWQLNSEPLFLDEYRTIELELEAGTYYYKFLIDNYFWCNDAQAKSYVNHDKEAINSVLCVGDNDKLLTSKEYGQVIDISLTNQFKEEFLVNEGKIDSQNCFSIQDNQIYIYSSIKDFVGEIELSYVWCRPDLSIYNAESTLLQCFGGKQRIYHYINLNQENLRPGKWKIFILVNGLLIETVEFLLKCNFYSYKNGKISFR